MKAKRDDLQIEDPDIRELLVGTWLAIGVVADVPAGSGELDRGQLFSGLGAAEAQARKLGRESHIAFAQWIVESVTQARQPSDDGPRRVIPFSSENSRGGEPYRGAGSPPSAARRVSKQEGFRRDRDLGLSDAIAFGAKACRPLHGDTEPQPINALAIR